MTNYSSKLPQNVIRIYDISHLKDYASKIKSLNVFLP